MVIFPCYCFHYIAHCFKKLPVDCSYSSIPLLEEYFTLFSILYFLIFFISPIIFFGIFFVPSPSFFPIFSVCLDFSKSSFTQSLSLYAFTSSFLRRVMSILPFATSQEISFVSLPGSAIQVNCLF